VGHILVFLRGKDTKREGIDGVAYSEYANIALLFVNGNIG